MDFVAGAHLLVEPLPFALSPPTTDAALVIVETRPSFFLPHVVASAVRTHPGWRLYVFGTEAVHALVGSLCTNYDIATRVTLDSHERMTVPQYSALLLSPAFWEAIREEHALVFQADCVLVRPVPPEAKVYDFIGAACGTLHPDRFVVNGGLSLRRVPAMRRAVALIRTSHPHLAELPEDVALCTAMRADPDPGFNLPTIEACNGFAIESTGDPATAIGLHGTDKYYAPRGVLAALLASAPR